MYSDDPDRPPAARSERWGFALFGLLLLGLLLGKLLGKLLRDDQPVTHARLASR